MVRGRRKTKPVIQTRVTHSTKKKGVLGSCSIIDGHRWGSNIIKGKQGSKGCNSTSSEFYRSKARVERFSRGKMVNPVLQTSGPNNKRTDDHFDMSNFDWKGRRGSFGEYETTNFTRQGAIYPLRLIYRKIPKNATLRKTSGNDDFANTRNEYIPAKYDLEKDDKDWLKSKHRILLYPSSSEESFMKRKLANPVPKATGPRDIDEMKLPIWSLSYDLKDEFESLGGYETLDVDKNNTYPLRLMYHKSTSKLSNLQTLNDRSLNFEDSEVCFGDERDLYIERNDKTFTKPHYKWKGMNGSLGAYEAPRNAIKGSTYPVRLWYSKNQKPVVNLESAAHEKESLVNIPKLKKIHYYWKGKNGSIGDYETMKASIFPVRMLHPKTRHNHPQLSSKTKDRTKMKVKNVRVPFRSINDIFPVKTLYPKKRVKCSNLNARKTQAEQMTEWPSTTWNKSDVWIPKHKEKCHTWKGKKGGYRPYESESTSITESLHLERLLCPETRLPPYVSHGRRNGKNNCAAKNKQGLSSPKSIQKQSELRNKNTEVSNSFISHIPSQIIGQESKDPQSQAEQELSGQEQFTPRSSQRTVFTTWSDDDLTSKEHSVSLSSNEGFGNNLQLEYIVENSFYAQEDETASLPQIPVPKSEENKEQGISMWPSESEESISKLPERKYLNRKNKQPRKSRQKTLKSSPGVWKPAKYNIADPAAEIKEKGIFSPILLYPRRGSNRVSKRRNRVGRKTV